MPTCAVEIPSTCGCSCACLCTHRQPVLRPCIIASWLTNTDVILNGETINLCCHLSAFVQTFTLLCSTAHQYYKLHPPVSTHAYMMQNLIYTILPTCATMQATERSSNDHVMMYTGTFRLTSAVTILTVFAAATDMACNGTALLCMVCITSRLHYNSTQLERRTLRCH